MEIVKSLDKLNNNSTAKLSINLGKRAVDTSYSLKSMRRAEDFGKSGTGLHY